MRIDAHQHFWHYNPAEHTWMTSAMTALRRDYLPDDLEPLLAQTALDGVIAVQARQNLAETAWLLALADRYPFIRGVVGWVDLCSPAIAVQLEQFAGHPKMVGVRHVVHDEPDDHFMLRPEFLRGLQTLEAFDLAYDLLLYPRHLPVAVQVVGQFPRQRFVLDHIAKPSIRDSVVGQWEIDLRALARFDNVSCKVSGLVTQADWNAWRPADFDAYLDIVFDCFGDDRLLFGSDWPVCTLASDYARVVGLVQAYTQRRGSELEAKVMGQNAIAWYGLADANKPIPLQPH